MTEPESLWLILIIGQWVIVPMIGLIVMSVRGIYREQRIQNGRLTKMEERLKGHIALDDSRLDALHESIREVIASLRELRVP